MRQLKIIHYILIGVLILAVVILGISVLALQLPWQQWSSLLALLADKKIQMTEQEAETMRRVLFGVKYFHWSVIAASLSVAILSFLGIKGAGTALRSSRNDSPEQLGKEKV